MIFFHTREEGWSGIKTAFLDTHLLYSAREKACNAHVTMLKGHPGQVHTFLSICQQFVIFLTSNKVHVNTNYFSYL